jgi:hypothetical protein
MLGVHRESVKRPVHYTGSLILAIIDHSFHISVLLHRWRLSVALTLRSLLDRLEQLRTRHRRRLTFLAPAMERRRPRIAAENYAARHSIEHTLDRKAELRRLAPTWPPAARRYHQLLTYELEGLREVVAALHSVTEGRELEECLAETSAQIDRLEIEVAWCARLLGKIDQKRALLSR